MSLLPLPLQTIAAADLPRLLLTSSGPCTARRPTPFSFTRTRAPSFYVTPRLAL